ncbi:unnamed protein product [[Actinomadura] parvosata subsp. kistnae]|nr:unnamed protein product [Actinomadura parvosata subsp. kistnae]
MPAPRGVRGLIPDTRGARTPRPACPEMRRGSSGHAGRPRRRIRPVLHRQVSRHDRQ